jgi:hypothetical protein
VGRGGGPRPAPEEEETKGTDGRELLSTQFERKVRKKKDNTMIHEKLEQENKQE